MISSSILLYANKPHTGVDNIASNLVSHSICSIDWYLSNMKAIRVSDVYSVIGYDKEYFYKKNITTSLVINDEWHKTKSGYSFLLALDNIDINSVVYVCYGDSVFRNNIFSSVQSIDADIVVTVDTKKDDVELIQLEKNIFEFTGFVKMSKSVVQYIKNNWNKEQYRKFTLSEIIFVN